MRITTFTSSKSIATDYYRSIGPLCRMAKQHKFDHIICNQEGATWHDIYNTDIVFIQRPNSTASMGIMADAKRMGKQVIIDFDDHLLDIPEDNPASAYFANAQVQKHIMETFTLADVIFVSTQALHDQYVSYAKGKPMIIVPNGWNPTDLPMTDLRPMNSPARFMWRGGSTHFKDLHTLKPQINHLMMRGCEVSFFGMVKFMAYDLDDSAQLIPWTSMWIYFDYLRKIDADAGFYPLVRNDFNLCKSNIFALECLANGMMVIADKYFPEFNIPGVVHYDNPTEFGDITNAIIAGDISKEQMVKAGRKHIRENLNIDLLNNKRWEIIKRL